MGLTSDQSMLIMDEVDGMSSGDRGGIAELASIIPSSKVCPELLPLSQLRSLSFAFVMFVIPRNFSLFLNAVAMSVSAALRRRT